MHLPGRRSHLSVANPNRQRGRANALRASGARVRKRDGDTMRRLIQPWQSRAFSYYDICPEVKYAAQFYSRMLSALRLYVGKIDSNGELVEVEDQNDPAITHLERIQDPGGGRSGLLGAYGRLMFLTGEGYLLVTRDEETDQEQWEMLSTDELRVTGAEITRYRAPSLAAENFREPRDSDFHPISDEDAVAYRLWKRHPRWSWLADSTMQGVLDVAEELVLLTQAVRSRARSRLAGAGILLVNEKVSPSPPDAVPDEDPEEDPFLKDLTDAMTTPIVDEGAASAVVPLVVRVSGVEKLDDAMKHLQIVDPTQLYPETGLRKECIERLAMGLDMPPEILLGYATANHWSGWIISDEVWRGHGQPISQQLVDDLTSAFLRPQLREDGVTDWMDYAITYDPSAVINHPDRSRDAKDLYDKRAIGKEALRDAAGFDEDDAPSEEELHEMIGVAVRDGSLAIYGIPSVKAGGIEPDPGVLEKAPDGGGSADVHPGPPDAEASRESDGAVTSSANGHALASRVLGASDLALQRARELAGNKLRSYAKRDTEALAMVEGVRAGLIASTLGRDVAKKIGAPSERELVYGAAALIADALRLWGIEEETARLLGERIEQHAARTLYEARPTPLPPSFENYVLGLSDLAKGARP